MKKILLAHGFLGFGNSRIDFGINYFNGIKAMLTADGFDVFAPSVSPIASLEVRGSQLAVKIHEHWPDDSEIYVIAHSMRGLDARRVIHLHPVVRRITKLITIATPHFGSRVADAVLGKNSKILRAIPELKLFLMIFIFCDICLESLEFDAGICYKSFSVFDPA